MLKRALLVCALLFQLMGYAQTETMMLIKPIKKTYFCSEQLLWDEEGPQIKIEEQWIRPAAIYTDSEGMYFDAICVGAFLEKQEGKYWGCPRCFWRNPPDCPKCCQCGYPRP
jgi:hypothetical protein